MIDAVEWALRYAGAIATIGAGLLSAAVWFVHKTMVTRSDFEAWSTAHATVHKEHDRQHAAHEATHDTLEKRLVEGDRAIDRLSVEIRHVAEDIEELTVSVAAARSELGGVIAQLSGVAAKLGVVTDLSRDMLAVHLEHPK
ncbi:MAG: hypothetical protein HQL39_16850 [Alphaproteobacteria bacterium]|nr:hypothetical protein [Alphaproteobacteria bacterium]